MEVDLRFWDDNEDFLEDNIKYTRLVVGQT